MPKFVGLFRKSGPKTVLNLKSQWYITLNYPISYNTIVVFWGSSHTLLYLVLLGTWIIKWRDVGPHPNRLGYILEGSVPKVPKWRPYSNSGRWNMTTRWWFQWFFIFTPTWGKWSNLTNIFQMGWNHLDDNFMIWYDLALAQLIHSFYFLFPIGSYCWDKHGCGLYLTFFLQRL